MEKSLPIPMYLLATVIVILTLTVVALPTGFYRGLKRAGYDDQFALRRAAILGAVLLGWIAIVGWLGSIEFFRAISAEPNGYHRKRRQYRNRKGPNSARCGAKEFD